MILIPSQIAYCENRQGADTYSRGGQFIEDFQSHVWLEIGSRWFGLADFTQLVHDVEYFYKNLMMPMYGLRYYDHNGHKQAMHFMDVEEKKPVFPMYFDADIRVEKYKEFNKEKAEVWRRYAEQNPNQQFK